MLGGLVSTNPFSVPCLLHPTVRDEEKKTFFTASAPDGGGDWKLVLEILGSVRRLHSKRRQRYLVAQLEGAEVGRQVPGIGRVQQAVAE